MYDRDAILAATDLAALADELLGPHVGSDSHPMWCCPSPNHAQTGRTPPVSVFTSRRDEQRWHCHGCGDGGSAIDLVMRSRNVDARAAIEDLVARSGISWRPSDPKDAQSRRIEGTGRSGGRTLQLTANHAAELDLYVEACAEELWSRAGRPARRWLMEHRGLSEGVLRANRVGADLGNPDLPRPTGCHRSGGAAILPVQRDGRAVYFQARILHPNPDRPRYLNPTAELAPNPKVSVIEPAERVHPETIITEGAVDALSAASAGFRAAAVLSAGYPDRYVALQLARLDGPLVLAMDADAAGVRGSAQLAEHLEALQRSPDVLPLDCGDLNEALQHAIDWPQELADRIAAISPVAATHQQLGVER